MIAGCGPIEGGSRASSSIRRGAVSASLWAQASGESAAELFLSIGERSRIKIDGSASSFSAARSMIPMLIFRSDHISLVRGGASHRRQLLDRIGPLISSRYAKAASDFVRAMKHKSAMLKRRSSAQALERTIAPAASCLWSERGRIVSMIAERIKGFPALMGDDISLCFVRGGGGRAMDAEDDYRLSSQEWSERERCAGMPLFGPQRDDIAITIGGLPPRDALSRGQSRRAATAIVLAAASIVESETRRRPVLVFDEVASELDESGARETFDALLSTGCQVFAATAAEHWHDGASIRRLEGGTFFRYDGEI